MIDDFKGYRKQILPIEGQLKLLLIIKVRIGRQEYIGQIDGYNSSNNIKNSFKDKDFRKNAVLNALYRFLLKKEISDVYSASVEYNVLNWGVRYSKLYIIKRKSIKGKYYNVVKNNDGKTISRSRYKSNKFEEVEVPDYREKQ